LHNNCASDLGHKTLAGLQNSRQRLRRWVSHNRPGSSRFRTPRTLPAMRQREFLSSANSMVRPAINPVRGAPWPQKNVAPSAGEFQNAVSSSPPRPQEKRSHFS